MCRSTLLLSQFVESDLGSYIYARPDMKMANELEMYLRLTLIRKSETVYKSNVQSAKLS